MTEEPVRTLAIVNQKGGSAKTTTAVNLSAALGEAGRRVLLIDMDPQAAASEWLGVRDADRALLDIILRDGCIADVITPTNAAGIHMVPSSAELARAEHVM